MASDGEKNSWFLVKIFSRLTLQRPVKVLSGQGIRHRRDPYGTRSVEFSRWMEDGALEERYCSHQDLGWALAEIPEGKRSP